MRFTTVKKHLPMGVALASTGLGSLLTGLFGESMPFVPVTERRSSNKPLELALEVPVGKERETAKALREMAEELERP